MKNFNSYDPDKFAEEFKNTEIYRKLCNDFNKVFFKKSQYIELITIYTPRELLGRPIPIFFTETFYFLSFLLEKNPDKIYDLGCGWNIFKKYIPNIIGIGAENPESISFSGDIHDYVDDEYITGHQNYFESVFSINALHFCPLREFSKIVNDFYSMISPGGRGYLALNLQRMIERDENLIPNGTPNQYDYYCRSELEKLKHIEFLAIDIDFENIPIDEGLDGNIKLVMQKFA